MPGRRRSSISPSARRGSSRTAGALRRQWLQRRTTTGLRDSSSSNKWPSIDLDGPRRPSTALPWHEKIIHKYLPHLLIVNSFGSKHVRERFFHNHHTNSLGAKYVYKRYCKNLKNKTPLIRVNYTKNPHCKISASSSKV